MQCPNCHTMLPAGSRFCNGCGAAIAAPQAYPTQYGQPAFNPNVTQAYPAAAPVPRKRPVALLAGLLALLIGGVGIAGMMVWKNNQSVVAAKSPTAPDAAGVTQAQSPDMPAQPALTNTRTPRAPNATPVTQTQPPSPSSAPPLTMANGSGAPSAPSVTQAQTPATPSMPPITQAPGAPQPSAPPVTQGRPNNPQPPAPPAPPDNSDFERYIAWLRYVENQRAGLRREAENQSFALIEGYMNALLGLADPDSNDAQMQAQMDQRLRVTFANAQRSIQTFQTNVTRTKPPVPADCRALDAFYMQAAGDEARLTADLIVAMSRRDIGAIKSIGRSGVGRIDFALGKANLELAKVYKGRGLNQLFEIETGKSSSMLGGLTGIGGLGF